MNKEELTPGKIRMARVGDFVEKTIGLEIEKHLEAPELEDGPEMHVWYRVSVPEGITGDGSEYHVYLKKAESDDLCIFLSGGGVAWNGYTAARPVTGAKVAAGLPNFYWNNLRPFTQLMNINTGITQIGNPANPFDSWNILVVAYATGDFHVGRNDFPYTAEDGSEQILHFHGHTNFLEAMKIARRFFPRPARLLIAGDSAGGFAVPAVTGTILEDFYPECTNVTLLSDSAQINYRNWRETAEHIWKSPAAVWQAIQGPNITVEWYRELYRVWGKRLRYLYAGSPRDFLLSSYENDVLTHQYTTDPKVQHQYFQRMQEMLTDLKKINPDFGFFIYNWPNLRMLMGGTVHTAVRHQRFFFRALPSGLTMAEWLGDAVNGNVYDVNLELMAGE